MNTPKRTTLTINHNGNKFEYAYDQFFKGLEIKRILTQNNITINKNQHWTLLYNQIDILDNNKFNIEQFNGEKVDVDLVIYDKLNKLSINGLANIMEVSKDEQIDLDNIHPTNYRDYFEKLILKSNVDVQYIVGTKGIGKTHSLIKIYNNNNDIFYINFEKPKDSNIISSFIDSFEYTLARLNQDKSNIESFIKDISKVKEDLFFSELSNKIKENKILKFPIIYILDQFNKCKDKILDSIKSNFINDLKAHDYGFIICSSNNNTTSKNKIKEYLENPTNQNIRLLNEFFSKDEIQTFFFSGKIIESNKVIQKVGLVPRLIKRYIQMDENIKDTYLKSNMIEEKDSKRIKEFISKITKTKQNQEYLLNLMNIIELEQPVEIILKYFDFIDFNYMAIKEISSKLFTVYFPSEIYKNYYMLCIYECDVPLTSIINYVTTEKLKDQIGKLIERFIIKYFETKLIINFNDGNEVKNKIIQLDKFIKVENYVNYNYGDISKMQTYLINTEYNQEASIDMIMLTPNNEDEKIIQMDLYLFQITIAAAREFGRKKIDYKMSEEYYNIISKTGIVIKHVYNYLILQNNKNDDMSKKCSENNSGAIIFDIGQLTYYTHFNPEPININNDVNYFQEIKDINEKYMAKPCFYNKDIKPILEYFDLMNSDLYEFLGKKRLNEATIDNKNEKFSLSKPNINIKPYENRHNYSKRERTPKPKDPDYVDEDEDEEKKKKKKKKN